MSDRIHVVDDDVQIAIAVQITCRRAKADTNPIESPFVANVFESQVTQITK